MSTVKERHPHVFVERDEDPRKRIRTVPMEVLSLGLTRTGTKTMQSALETLGIPTWHWSTMTENPPDIAAWYSALQAKFEPGNDIKPFGRAQFDALLGKWGATTDQPTCFFGKDLINAYPEAKVVLIERDTDSWFKSYDREVIRGVQNPFLPFLTLINRGYIGAMGAVMDIEARHIFQVSQPRTKGLVFNNPKFFDQWREKAKDVYEAHNQLIKSFTPKERLLVFKLEDGWEPLCKFLNRPIPDIPFPHLKKGTVVQEETRVYIAEGYKRSAIKFVKRTAPLSIGMLALFIYWRREGSFPNSVREFFDTLLHMVYA